MELQQLKYFKAVAELGNLTAAAEALFVTAPAISTSISRLEDELGVQLFERTKGRLTLNAYGQFFLRHINQALDTLDYAAIELRKNLMIQGQHVSLACVTSAQWADMVTAFTLEHPRFTLSCTEYKRSDIVNNGLPAQHNFLLTCEDGVPDFVAAEMDSIVLFEDALMIAVARSHPFADKESVNLEDLLSGTLLLPMTNYSMYERLADLCTYADLTMPSGSAYPHATALKIAEKGLGIAFTTQYATRSLSMDLRYVPISDQTHPWVYRLYWRKTQHLTEDEEIFKQFVQIYYNENH